MGDKLSAKQIAVACGVPTTPGTTEPLKSREAAQKLAMEFGFPVILKAAAGGGGRGMRRCDTVEEVGTNFDLVKAEAKKAFGNDDIFMEKFLVEPKHIEVQVLGDEEGNVVHLFERDCSLQRRYQKVVEFSPAFSVDQEIRQALYEDAVKIAKARGLCERRHPGVPGGQGRAPLLHRDEPPYPGGAHRHRDGDGRGPGALSDSDRRGLSSQRSPHRHQEAE